MSKKKARKAAKRKLRALKRAGDVKGVLEVLGLAAVAFAAGVAGSASKEKLIRAGREMIARVRDWRREHSWAADANGMTSDRVSAR